MDVLMSRAEASRKHVNKTQQALENARSCEVANHLT